MKLLTCLLVTSALATGSFADAGGKGRLTAKQKREVRKEIRSQFSQSSERYRRNGRKPKVEAVFTAKGKTQVKVESKLTAIWRGRRQTIGTATGVVEKRPGGQWRFRNGRGNDLRTPKDAVDAMRLRRPGRIRSAVVSKNKSTTSVIHFEPDSGDNIYLSRVSNKGRREIVSTSKNLAGPIKTAVRSAHVQAPGEQSSVHLQRLAKNGRSMEVRVHTSRGTQQWYTDYVVRLSKSGKPVDVRAR
jgi:hypothetical protein